MRPRETVTVRDGESFISLYPGDGMKVTVGIDHQAEAPVIGKQWYTFDVEKDMHYRWVAGGLAEQA
jgi:UDP-3-O-[3-hydroxymyristoyl] N-acetylglucosamine deacetylase